VVLNELPALQLILRVSGTKRGKQQVQQGQQGQGQHAQARSRGKGSIEGQGQEEIRPDALEADATREPGVGL
jgi:hypothetical protein